MIAAQQYYIDYSSDMNVDRLLTLLPNYIPDYCLTGVEKAVDRWAALVVQAYKKSYYVKEKVISHYIYFYKLIEICTPLMSSKHERTDYLFFV